MAGILIEFRGSSLLVPWQEQVSSSTTAPLPYACGFPFSPSRRRAPGVFSAQPSSHPLLPAVRPLQQGRGKVASGERRWTRELLQSHSPVTLQGALYVAQPALYCTAA